MCAMCCVPPPQAELAGAVAAEEELKARSDEVCECVSICASYRNLLEGRGKLSHTSVSGRKPATKLVV